MSLPSEPIVQRIVDVFRLEELPDGQEIFLSYSPEVDAQKFESLARQGNWTDFPHEVLCSNPAALAFMTPAAFAWLLPACLVVSVTRYSECDSLTSMVLTCLTPADKDDSLQFETLVDETHKLDPDLLLEDTQADALDPDDGTDELFTERVAQLTGDEKTAVREYLEYMEAVHGRDFPLFGPRQALERYWAKVSDSA